MDGNEALDCLEWNVIAICGYLVLVFRDAVCYDAVSNTLIFPEEKHEQSIEPSLLHETSNISPDPDDSDSYFEKVKSQSFKVFETKANKPIPRYSETTKTNYFLH